MANIVAIVGRPNVGKSTLFNRITESRKAIVDEQSGVTRDRHFAKANWSGREFTIIDTGGYISGSEDVFEGEIRKQVEISISEASIILFVVDVTSGITDLDDVVALCAVLDMVITTKMTVVYMSAGVGTPTKLANWKQSYWNNLLSNPQSNSVDMFERNTWESWDNVFKLIAKDINLLMKKGS